MPPARTGVAVYSAELVGALRAEHELDVFVSEAIAGEAKRAGRNDAVHSAHDFIWRHQLAPYDLTVYQLGNSSLHDFLWPYLFRYPGLAVLHDAHLHHARAAALMRLGRTNDYREEFEANEPDSNSDLAELAVAGFDTHLYYGWPMTRLIARASRVTAVHAPRLVEALREAAPDARIESIRLGHGERIGSHEAARASARVRERHGIPANAVIFGVQGGLTPEKRVPQVLAAFASVLPYTPSARLLLAGEPASYCDVEGTIASLGLRDRAIVTGYLPSDDAFTEYVAACDVSINLRWPTAREVSGPWVRALAAGRPTITMDLAHGAHVPALDPRTWTMPQSATPEAPVTVSIDVLDEDHSLRLAMRRLAADADLRGRLGRAAGEYWEREHSMAGMLNDYRRVLALAQTAPAPAADLPTHLRSRGDERLERLLQPFGLEADVWSNI